MKHLIRLSLSALLVITMASCCGPKVNTVTRIWDEAEHCAFTSLIEYDGWLYCTFREAGSHITSEEFSGGKLRIIRSKNGKKWESVDLLVKEGYDLRDACLVVLPSGELAMYCGVSKYVDGDLVSFQSHYSIMKDGHFSDPKLVMTDFNSTTQWLWKVRKHNNILYTISYGGGRWVLLSSEDGLNFKTIKEFDLASKFNEADIQFVGDEMMVLARNCDEWDDAYIGRSLPPYSDWKWTATGYAVGGPEICGEYASGRQYTTHGTKTSIYKIEEGDQLRRLLTVPSGGDCSYPAILLKNNQMYYTYYSSHENNTAIYFAKFNLKDLENLEK